MYVCMYTRKTILGPKHLGDDETCDGLMYTAITRVTKAANLGFADGVTLEWITRKICEKKWLHHRIAEENRLDHLHSTLQQRLATATVDKVLTFMLQQKRAGF